jgi:hypothetical protein
MSSQVTLEGYRASMFTLLATALLAAFLVADDVQDMDYRRLRWVPPLQSLLRWLLVEPLGEAGAVALVAAAGVITAIFLLPRGVS